MSVPTIVCLILLGLPFLPPAGWHVERIVADPDGADVVLSRPIAVGDALVVPPWCRPLVEDDAP